MFRLINNTMNGSDRKSLDDMILAYESMSFQRSTSEDFDPHIEQIKTQIKVDIHTIESKIKGIIAYYNSLKNRAEAIPTDKENTDKLHKLKEYLVKHLGWASQFTDD